MRLFITLLILGHSLIAQVSQDIRVEYDESIADYFTVLTLESQKSAVVKYVNESKEKRKVDVYTYELLNEELKKQKSIQIEHAKPDFPLERSLNNGNFHYQLFCHPKSGVFNIYKIDLSNLKTLKIDGNFGKKFTFYQMTVAGDFAYISCRLKKKLLILTVDLLTGIVTNNDPQLKLKSKAKLVFRDIQTVKTTNGFEVFFQYEAIVSKRDKKMCYYRFGADGTPFGDLLYNPNPSEGTFILESSFTKTKDGTYMVVGAFAKNSKMFANGIYVANMSENKLTNINYYNFLDIKDFMKVAGLNEEKIEKKKEKAESKGDEYFLKYRFLAPRCN